MKLYKPEVDCTQLMNDIISNEQIFLSFIGKLARGKAMGPDELANETLRWAPPHMQQLLHLYIQVLWKQGYTPKPWSASHTSLIYKKGDPTILSNYRPIAMASVLLKLWTGIFTTALSHVCESQGLITHAQEGFRKLKSTARQLNTLVKSIEDAHLFDRDIFILFVDFSSAFNMVDHQRLEIVLRSLGIPEQALKCISTLYGHATTTINTNLGPTDPIRVTRGTLQGDTLSPLLFLLYIEPLLRWIHVGGKGYRYGCLTNEENDTQHLAAAAYADDLAAVTNTVKDMEDQASKITSFCKWARLEVNVKKCAVTGGLFQTWRTEGLSWQQRGQDERVLRKLQNIFLCGKKVEPHLPKKSYTYLGLPLNIQLDWRPAFSDLKAAIKNRTRNILYYTSLKKAYRNRMVEETIMPLPLYAAVLTPFTHTQLREIEGLLAQAKRKALGLPCYSSIWSLTAAREQGGIGNGSLYSHYVQAAGRNLITCLNEPGRLSLITNALLKAQLQVLKEHPCFYSPAGWDTAARFATSVRQLTLLSQAGLYINKEGQRLFTNSTTTMDLVDLLKSIPTYSPTNPSGVTTNRATKLLSSLWELGITRLGQIMEPDQTHIMGAEDLKKCIPAAKATHLNALNTLTRLLNDPGLPNSTTSKSVKSLPSASRALHPQYHHLLRWQPTFDPTIERCWKASKPTLQKEDIFKPASRKPPPAETLQLLSSITLSNSFSTLNTACRKSFTHPPTEELPTSQGPATCLYCEGDIHPQDQAPSCKACFSQRAHASCISTHYHKL